MLIGWPLEENSQRLNRSILNKYDDVVEKVNDEVKIYTEKLNLLIAKEDSGVALSSKEEKRKKSYSSYLKAYDQIMSGTNEKLGTRANCENLIPLYTKEFEANKDNAVWLQRAAGRMSEKECTDDPLFFDLVNAYHNLSPSANSAYYLGLLKDKEGKSSEAITFYEQAINLQTDNFEKAKLLYKIASKFKTKRSYGKARNYYRKALSANPSMGKAHLAIAQMYAASANNCGDTGFNKRSVFWLAANEARRAGKVDPTLKKASSQTVANYMSKAPSKGDIFNEGNAGESIKIGCWIGSSVTVPNL